MNCINFKIRTKRYERYFFCSKHKKNITFEECKNCNYKEYKKIYKIKNKSNKLKKMETRRFSILTNDFSKCYLCNKTKEHIHEIFGGRNRKISMLNGFTIPICKDCHRKTEENMKFDLALKIKCQEEYMKTHTEDEFMSLIGKSYIKERG